MCCWMPRTILHRQAHLRFAGWNTNPPPPCRRGIQPLSMAWFSITSSIIAYLPSYWNGMLSIAWVKESTPKRPRQKQQATPTGAYCFSIVCLVTPMSYLSFPLSFRLLLFLFYFLLPFINTLYLLLWKRKVIDAGSSTSSSIPANVPTTSPKWLPFPRSQCPIPPSPLSVHHALFATNWSRKLLCAQTTNYNFTL